MEKLKGYVELSKIADQIENSYSSAVERFDYMYCDTISKVFPVITDDLKIISQGLDDIINKKPTKLVKFKRDVEDMSHELLISSKITIDDYIDHEVFHLASPVDSYNQLRALLRILLLYRMSLK